MSEPSTEVKCGNDNPGTVRSEHRAEIILRTDRYNNKKGFQIKYHLSGEQKNFVVVIHFINMNTDFEDSFVLFLECGGIVTEPGVLAPLSKNNAYYESINCTWNIKAPESQNIILRFNTFILEYSMR